MRARPYQKASPRCDPIYLERELTDWSGGARLTHARRAWWQQPH